MKTAALFVVLAALSMPVVALDKDPKTESGLQQLVAGVAKERKAIMQVLKDYEKAFRAKDLDGIMAIYDPDVVAYDITPPLRYEGAAAYRKSWQQFLETYDGPLEMEIRDLKLSFSGAVAVTYNLERFSGKLKGGEHSEIWVRVTDVYSKKDGKWRIVHEHASVPVDFATGKAVMDLKP